MTIEQIKELALECGFKLEEQPNGEMDLNPYVYDFAQTLLQEHATNYVLSSLRDKKVNWSLNKGGFGYTINIILKVKADEVAIGF